MLAKVFLDAMHPKADRHGLGLPEPRANVQLGVAHVGELGEDAPVGVEEAIADGLNRPSCGVLGQLIAVLPER